MRPTNLLFILSDQHNRHALGCYGNPVIQTPHLDRLAESGVRFTSAYTTCPICVPARASLATGRYVHQLGNWDNAFPYDGSVPGWGHQLKAQGYRVDSIGKLHFRTTEDDNGFTEEIDPLHVVDGLGDVLGCIRENPPLRDHRPGIIGAGPGESTYLDYDVRNADSACAWLRQHAQDERPWVLFLSFVCPHPPYTSPQDTYHLYAPENIPLPSQWKMETWPDHPALNYCRQFFGFDKGFDEAVIRKMNAAYYGVCTFLDSQIGRVLDCLKETSLHTDTRVIYTSDHGESLGARGLFGKFTMYDESAGIPLIIAGPDVPQGHVCDTPVSLVDCYPTILEAVGCPLDEPVVDRPGVSLWSIMTQADLERTVFSEYHAVGSRNATYMLRDRRYKYVHYVGAPRQLFDLVADPDELRNLAAEMPDLTREYEQRLRVTLDPDVVDAHAKADQQRRVAAFGGEAAVRRRGSFVNSPVPGEAPKFVAGHST